MRKPSEKTKNRIKRDLRTINYGLAGTIVGTAIGYKAGHKKLGGRAGAGAGVALGMGIESAVKKRKNVKEQKASHGNGVYQTQVGTKTNARVGKKDHPYMVKQPSKRVQKISAQIEKEQNAAKRSILA